MIHNAALCTVSGVQRSDSVIYTYIPFQVLFHYSLLRIWPPDAKNCLLGKDPDAGKDGKQEEKGTLEDEKAGWHHQLDGHGFESALGVGDGQGGLVCCGSWGCKDLDTTNRLT